MISCIQNITLHSVRILNSAFLAHEWEKLLFKMITEYSIDLTSGYLTFL